MTTLEILWVLSFPVTVLLAVALLGIVGPGRGLALAALAIGAYGLAGDAGMLARQLDLRRWQPVQATVVVSERGRRANDWQFVYEYEREDGRHRGSRLDLRPHLRGRGDTDRLAEEFPVGRSITVFTDPEEPGRSVVDATPGFALPLVGFALHGALLGAFVRARARGRRAAA